MTWKLAEDGRGTILRMVEIGGHATTATVRFARYAPHVATRCNAVEDDEAPLRLEGNALSLTLKPYEIVTARIK